MNRRRAIFSIGAGAASLAIPVAHAHPDTRHDDSPLFSGDFETGNHSQFFASESSGGAISPKPVTIPTRSDNSNYSCAYSLSGEQYRCESVPAYDSAPFVGTEGADLFYSWSVFFPEYFPNGAWQICGQWHQTDLGGAGRFDKVSPPMAIYITTVHKELRWSLANNGNNPWKRGWSIDLGILPRESWTDLIVHAKFSADPQRCLVQLWLNGVSVGKLTPPIPLIYPTESEKAQRASYFKVGYYRDRRMKKLGTVVFDDIKIGRSLESVS